MNHNILNVKYFTSKEHTLLIFITVVLALLQSIFSSFEIIALTSILLFSLISIYKKRVLFILAITSYLAFTNEIFSPYRIYINLFATLSLLTIFIKEFGIRVRYYPKVPKEIVSFLGFLFLSLTVSIIFSNSPLIGIIASGRMALFMLISYFFYSFLKDEYNIYDYIYALLFVALILGFWMFLDLYNLGFQNYVKRIIVNETFNLYSKFGYTGLTGFFISISFLTSMFFLKKFQSKKNKIVISILLVVNILIIILANSRGGILATIFSVSFLLIVLKKSLFFKYFALTALIILSLVLTISPIFDAVNTYLRWNTVGDREVYWQMGLNVISDHPIFGLGPDLFHKYFYYYAPSGIINNLTINSGVFAKPHPHNFFLYFTAENGILGFFTSILFFIMFFYFAISTMRTTKNRSYDYFVLSTTITGIGIGLFFRSFIEITGYLAYGTLTSDLPFWLIFGILISIYQKFHKTDLIQQQIEF